MIVSNSLVNEVASVMEGVTSLDVQRLGKKISNDILKNRSTSPWTAKLMNIAEDDKSFSIMFGLIPNLKGKVDNNRIEDVFDLEHLRPSDKVKQQIQKIIEQNKDITKVQFSGTTHIATGGTMYVDGVHPGVKK